MQAESGAQTVDQFCEKWKISRSTFYRRPPTLVKIGAASRITPEHEREWAKGLPVVLAGAA
jgi:hypothetical protein